jgi:hypothetical protein
MRGYDKPSGAEPAPRSRFGGVIETLDTLRREGSLYRLYTSFELVVSAVLLISVSLIIVDMLAALAVTLFDEFTAGVHLARSRSASSIGCSGMRVTPSPTDDRSPSADQTNLDADHQALPSPIVEASSSGSIERRNQLHQMAGFPQVALRRGVAAARLFARADSPREASR